MYPHWRNTPENELEWFEALVSLARYLRGPEGCPWDREQRAADFIRFAHEEAAELLDASQKGSADHIEEEFGDVFFVLLAAAAAAEEEGLFRLENALRRIHEKMIRRHEHVFGDTKAETPEDAIDRWNSVKAREKAGRNEDRGGAQ